MWGKPLCDLPKRNTGIFADCFGLRIAYPESVEAIKTIINVDGIKFGISILLMFLYGIS